MKEIRIVPTAEPADFVSHLRAQVATYGDSREYVYSRQVGRELVEETHTYGEIDRNARAFAVWLGTQPAAKHPVLLLYIDGIDFLVAYLGCLYAGVVAVPAPVPHDARAMARVGAMFADADIRLVLTTSAVAGPLSSWTDQSDLDVAIIATDTTEMADPDSWVMPTITGDSLAFLQYTSGSTSEPKGVMVTHANLLHNCESMRIANGGDDSLVGVGWLPHFHDMGLIGMLLMPMYMGGNLAFMSPMAFLKRPVRWLQLIDRYRANMTIGPNFAYDLIARRITDDQLAGLDLSSLRVVLNGAEPIRPRTLEAVIDKLGPYGFRADAFFTAYGMAEMTLLATASTVGTAPVQLDVDPLALERNQLAPMSGGTRLVSSGKAIGCDIRMVDPNTCTEVSDGQVGEIWIRGGSVAAGYWNRPAETAEKFEATIDGEGPFLRTGDLGVRHEAEIFVTGRLKDLLIVNGRNIYPQDIEEAVREMHPALQGAAGVVLAIDTGRHERLVVIHEVKTALVDIAYPDLAKKLAVAVARTFDVPAPSIVLVDRHGVHRTTSGKVQRKSMHASFLADLVDSVLYEDVDPVVAALRDNTFQSAVA
jgi:acyl-CoA synthetase (AMP-forming)/AMP-acid ligase II